MVAILDATARVLLKEGYEHASTNRIASVAGVSIGSLYQYFPNKESLVYALIERHVTEMMELVGEKIVELADAPLPVAVRALIDAMISAHRIDPKLHKVVAEQVPRLGRLEDILDMNRKVEQLIEAHLSLRREELRPKNLHLATFILVHAVEAVTHAAVVEGHRYIEDDELIDELTELVLRYVGAR